MNMNEFHTVLYITTVTQIEQFYINSTQIYKHDLTGDRDYNSTLVLIGYPVIGHWLVSLALLSHSRGCMCDRFTEHLINTSIEF